MHSFYLADDRPGRPKLKGKIAYSQLSQLLLVTLALAVDQLGPGNKLPAAHGRSGRMCMHDYRLRRAAGA